MGPALVLLAGLAAGADRCGADPGSQTRPAPPPPTAEAPEEPVPFTTILQVPVAYEDRWNEPQGTILGDGEQLCAFWSGLAIGLPDPPACDPALVDFQTQVALAVGLGRRGGCHREAEVTQVTRGPDGRTLVTGVRYDLPPEKGRSCPADIFSIVQIITIPRPAAPVAFTFRQVIRP